MCVTPRIGSSAAGGQAFTILLVKVTKKRHTNAKICAEALALNMLHWTDGAVVRKELHEELLTSSAFHRLHA